MPGFQQTASAAIIVHGQTRLTFHVTVPAHAAFVTRVGLANLNDPLCGAADASFMVGVSDGRSFRQLRTLVLRDRLAKQYIPIEVSLAEYSGMTIDLILNTRMPLQDGSQSDVVWIDPAVAH